MHDRKLVLGSVALTMARLRPAKAVAAALNNVRDDLEREIVRSDYLDGAPFRWVGLILREGLADEAEPHYQGIDPEDGELPLAMEIDVHRLLGRSRAEMERVFRQAALRALIHAGTRYGLAVDRLTALAQAE